MTNSSSNLLVCCVGTHTCYNVAVSPAYKGCNDRMLEIVLQVYCDFHGHSQIKNFVLYGCPDPSGGTVTEVVEQPTCVCMHMYYAYDHTCMHTFTHIFTYTYVCTHV